MVSTCCAYGCTYRHQKGDTTGIYRFPKDKTLRKLWTLAVRRSNWSPTPFTRICGKHFQSGKPSQDKNHPDYVPNVFTFNQNGNPTGIHQRIAKENASQEVKPIVILCHAAEESDNAEATEVSKNIEKSLNPEGKNSTSPQCVWLSNVASEENNLIISNENKKETKINSTCISSKAKMKQKVSNSIPNCDQVFIPTCEVDTDLHKSINSITVSNENSSSSLADTSLTAFEDTSSVNAESCIADDDSDSAQSFMTINNDGTLTDESSLPTITNVPLNTESTTTTNKNSVDFNVEYTSENVKTNIMNILSNISLPIIKPVKETTENDYSYFKSAPHDTKEILAIKLETMLAVNISLQEKVRFYRNRCKLYESEINNLVSTLKRLKELVNYVNFNNSF